MEIIIHNDIKQAIPHFKLGVIHYTGINVDQSPLMLKGRLRLFQEKIFFDLENKKVTELDSIQEWRQIFKAVGCDPNRYRPSNEALFRRLQKQQFLNYVNSAVDLNNFFSLQYEIPFGIYDSDQISGNVIVKIGSDEDRYDAVNGRDVNMKNKLLTADDDGAFGSPYVDSKRTAVSFDTNNALHLIYCRPSMELNEAKKMIDSIANMFTQIHGGDAKFNVIS